MCTTYDARTRVLIEVVREWRQRWTVRVVRAQPGYWPRTEWREYVAETPGELRAIIVAARADPRALSWKYLGHRDLVGEDPEMCRRGHRYDVGRFGNARQEWVDCCCGGHFV